MTYDRAVVTAERTIASVLAVMIATVAMTSTLVDVGLIAGTQARIIMWSSVGLLTAIAVRPSRTLHVVALGISALVLFGRGASFVSLVLNADRPDLWGAVAERFAMFVIVIIWHLLRIMSPREVVS